MADYRHRVGIGYDVHRFVDDRPLVLGGVTIPYGRGLEGHSDADVLLHAISDALLGACALGDIGHHFPDTADVWAGADSAELLRRVRGMVVSGGFEIVNVDATVALQAPKLSGHIPEMRKRIAECLEVSPSDVSVKATTTERLGFVGRHEGAAALAVACVRMEIV